MDYHRLLAEEGQEGSSSGDEKAYIRPRSRWPARSTIALLILSATTLLSTLALLWITMLSPSQPAASSCALGDEIVHSKYGRNEDRMSLDHGYDYVWEEVLTPGWGGVKLVPEGQTKEVVGGISMMHQLHCLGSLRKALQESRDGKDIGLDHHDNIHWPHCMDYLFETLLCYADGTIETSPTGDLINGEQDVRTCRDPNKLFKLLEQNALPVEQDHGHGHGHGH
ncbi:hypothetical protein NA57DRAFT_76396 [Rhizodiscina lignyota]|uniref:Oxidase ustYa n=1 Tax=Rhizodiscina lignyota TaxID=1504668 RepID=A0A9P4IE29_9PEZI|nr:hypothetical protein NA57DRAFT_76396 [Rhizodiscina lignyota]